MYEITETHCTIADVAASMENVSKRPIDATTYTYLPLYAKVAVDRLACDYSLRSSAKLDELLCAYATCYQLTVDILTCANAHRICASRFSDFDSIYPI